MATEPLNRDRAPRAERPGVTRLGWLPWCEIQSRVAEMWAQCYQSEAAHGLICALLCTDGPLHEWDGTNGFVEIAGVWCWQQDTSLTKRPSAPVCVPLPRDLADAVPSVLELAHGSPSGSTLSACRAQVSRQWRDKHPAIHGWLCGGNARAYAGLHDVSLSVGQVWQTLIQWQADLLALAKDPIEWPRLPSTVCASAGVGPPDETLQLRAVLSELDVFRLLPQASLKGLISYHNCKTLATMLALEVWLGLRPAAATNMAFQPHDRLLDVVDKGPESRRFLPLMPPVSARLMAYRAHLDLMNQLIGSRAYQITHAIHEALKGRGPLLVAVETENAPPGWHRPCEPTECWRHRVAPALAQLAPNVGRHSFETAVAGALPFQRHQAWMGRSRASQRAMIVRDHGHLDEATQAAVLRDLADAGWQW